MNRARVYTTWALISASLAGCAAGSRSANEHDLNFSRAAPASGESAPTPTQTSTPPSLEDVQGGLAKPPVVLRSGAETADYSYATGCFHAYERICGKLLTDQQRGACHEDGLSVCEKYGHEFGEWIRGGAGAGAGRK